MSFVRRTSFVLLPAAVLVVFSACSGNGGSLPTSLGLNASMRQSPVTVSAGTPTPAATSAVKPALVPVVTATATATPTATAAPATPTPAPTNLAAVVSTVSTTTIASLTPVVGAMDGSTCVVRPSGSVWQPGEDLCITFPSAVNGFNYSISPSAPSETVGAMNGDARTIQVQFDRASGTTYTVSFPTVNTASGQISNTQVSVVAPSVAAQTLSRSLPLRHVSNYFGTLVQDATAPFGLLDSLDAPYPIDQTKLNVLVAQGVQIARVEISPFFANPVRGVYDFSKFDPVIGALAGVGINAYVEIRASAPQGWATNNSTQPSALYADPSDYAAFCGAVATHLATAFPGVSEVAISDNEPNFSSNWNNLAGAALSGNSAYNDGTGAGDAIYMKPCYAAIKAANPRLQVFGPEMAFGGTTDAIPFLENLYANGCRVGVCFDGLSMHLSPYNDMSFPTGRCFYQGAGWTGRCYKDAQQVALDHGDPLPPVILSETGYSSANIPQGYDEAGQALLMSREYATLEADPSVQGAFWSYIDGNGTPPNTYFGEYRTVHSDGSHKAAFDVLREFATY